MIKHTLASYEKSIEKLKKTSKNGSHGFEFTKELSIVIAVINKK